MKKILCALLGLALTAGVAQAANLKLYFSTTGLAGGVLNAPPPEATSHVNPSVGIGTTVHLYAEVTDAGTWNGVALDYTGANGAVTLLQSTFLGLNRWNGNSDFAGALNGSNPTNLVAVQEQGLPNPFPLGQFDNLEAAGGSVAGAETFYLGSSTTTAAGNVFLHVGQGGISRVGGDPNVDTINFGWGDGTVHGNQFGAATTAPDLTVTPEPASFALIALGALALRRR